MSKGTEILLAGVREADLDDYVRLAREVKDREGEADVIGRRLKEFAEAEWLKRFEATGLKPDSPFKLLSRKGKSVSFVVTDKSSGYALKPEADTDLRALLGDETVGKIVTDSELVEIDDEVMQEIAPGPDQLTVGAILACRLGTLRYEMCADGLLTDEQARRIFHFRHVREVKPGLMAKLPELARKARVRIIDLIAVLGSAFTRTIKA